MDAIVPYDANIDAHIAHIVNAISVHQARILHTNNHRNGVREEVHHVQP